MDDNLQSANPGGDNDLFDSSFDNLLHHQFLEHEEVTKKFELLEEMEAISYGDKFQPSELMPQPSNSLELERTQKNGKCNLRQSLAWDNAFFTSEGFLEPDELSSMLEGAHSDVNKILHSIQEDDMHRSMDSISTMDSDCLTLKSCEADLFQDIRASIQRSSKASREPNFSNQTGLADIAHQIKHSSRKVGIGSQNKVNPKHTPKKPSIDTQGSGKSIQRSSISRQVSEPIARGRELAASLPRVPKALHKAFPISVTTPKRTSLGANRIISGKDNSSSSTGRLGSSRTLGESGSRSDLPRSKQSLRLSSTSSLTNTKTETTTSCSSLESVVSVSSKIARLSPSSSSKRNKLPPPSPCPNFVLRNKTQQGNSHRSTHLKSSTKLSSSTSSILLASTISESSCESSSSTSSIKTRFSNAKVNHATSSSCKAIDNNTNSKNSQFQFKDQSSAPYGIQETKIQSPLVNDDVKGNSASAKPSGLRIPSPKIGFFDGAKSFLRTPRGSAKLDSCVPSSVRKSESGCSYPIGATNIKLRNVQTTSLNPLRKTPPNPKVSSASKAVGIIPALSPKDQNMKSKTGERGRLKVEEKGVLVNRAEFDVGHCLGERVNSPDKYKLPKSSYPKEARVEVSLNIISSLSSLKLSPVTSSDLPDHTRSPFSVVNSLGGNDREKGSSFNVAEDMNTLLPLAAQKENNQGSVKSKSYFSGTFKLKQ